jgi:hypothetical protein
MEKIHKSIPIRVGVVVELDGKFWGVQYREGEGTRYDFGPIENAMVSDPDRCKSPEDIVWEKSVHKSDLKNAKLRNVTETRVYEVE